MYNHSMSNSFFDEKNNICPHKNLKAKINLERCKRCYKCVSRCPQGAIVMGEKGYPCVDSAKCNGCQLCKKSCIDFYYETSLSSHIKEMSSVEFEIVVEKFLNKYNLLSENEVLVVGFSGGFDSCALLWCLKQLQNKYKFKLCAGHLNHNWRAQESEKEEQNCRDFCENNHIEFYSEKLSDDVAKTETMAREARYEFFERCAKHFSSKIILTAHNKTDNVETLIYRIAKGTGVKGLCGIDEKRELSGFSVYRPILSLSREDIESYCAENKLSPNNDSSNFNTKYRRNFIRHEVVPMLEKINFNAKNAISSLSENARENEEIVNEYMQLVKNDILVKNVIKTDKFMALSQTIKKRLIYDFITAINLDYDRKKILEILDFIDVSSSSKSGKTLSLTNNLWLFCSKKEIYIMNKIPTKNEMKVKIVDFNGSYKFGNCCFKIEEFSLEKPKVFPKEDEKYAYVDLSKQKSLELRYRKAGDKIQPFGMKNLIKLKDFFINKGVAKHKKDEIMLLCNQEEVLWACTVGISEKLRVKGIPTHIIRIEEV